MQRLLRHRNWLAAQAIWAVRTRHGRENYSHGRGKDEINVILLSQITIISDVILYNNN